MNHCLSLTHRKDVFNDEGYLQDEAEHVCIYIDAPAETIAFYLEAQGDLACQFYVTKWTPAESDARPPEIAGHTNGDEWLEARGG